MESVALPEPPAVANAAGIPSPALILFHEIIGRNLHRMIALAGGPQRLRPHVKTHKLAELVRWQVELGITKFKVATIAEAEMTAAAGAAEVLLAYPLVGAAIPRWFELQRRFPEVRWQALVDDRSAAAELSRARPADLPPQELLVDLDVGQQRTGIAPSSAAAFIREVFELPGLRFGGLHAYDGHLHQSDPAERRAACDAAFAAVEALSLELTRAGTSVPRIVAGGTPTFPIHAERAGVECSPGTCVLWDAGYARQLPDLAFEPAAWLLARVISRPAAHRVCLDLGHKAVASEMTPPRVVFPDLPEARWLAHNEEHLVLETPRASEFRVGRVLLGIPWHVCPTVALHAEAWVVKGTEAVERWTIAARARRLTC